MIKNILYSLSLLALILCKDKSAISDQSLEQEEIKISNKTKPEKEVVYTQFKPDSISGLKIKGFSIDYSFKLNKNKIVVGYYEPIDGNITLPDTEKDWGDRLLYLNSKNEIIYKAPGAGDVFQYEPYFYKNKKNDKTLVICQLAYEYFFGGDVFLIEKGKIKYLGNLDIEPNNMEKKLTDILKINELNNDINFTFDSDSLVLKPGSDDIIIKNNNVKYVYDNKSLKLYK